ncbi:CoA pyrophosphatase [Niveispirillum irakense]|uniref:CoA pyrophosphatase n=1 Tax=Niveispirillum irakense TaxID=34011 RepID=UPI000491E92B
MEQGNVLSAGPATPGVSADIPTENAIRELFMRRRTPPSRMTNVRGDQDGNPGFSLPAELRDAAVLVPLVDRPDGFTVLLTQRTAHLAAHAGQISFPGGRVEPEDKDPHDTALRETEEEIGLPRHRIELLGHMDTYITRTGFRVVPVVGFVRPPFILNPDPHEVAEIFEVPLSFILDPASRRRETREFKGAMRHFWAFPYGERYIWGATAGMLINLCDLLDGLRD